MCNDLVYTIAYLGSSVNPFGSEETPDRELLAVVVRDRPGERKAAGNLFIRSAPASSTAKVRPEHCG